MTDDMMILRTLLEKSSDADLVREMIGFRSTLHLARASLYWETVNQPVPAHRNGFLRTNPPLTGKNATTVPIQAAATRENDPNRA